MIQKQLKNILTVYRLIFGKNAYFLVPKKIYLAVESLIGFAEIQMNALFLVFLFFLFLGLNNNVRSSGFHKNLFMYDGSCKYCEIIIVYKGLLWITLAHDLHPQERTYKHVFNIDENTSCQRKYVPTNQENFRYQKH